VTAPVTHGSWVTWVMGQELNGSLGSWVTLTDPFPALLQQQLGVQLTFDRDQCRPTGWRKTTPCHWQPRLNNVPRRTLARSSAQRWRMITILWRRHSATDV